MKNKQFNFRIDEDTAQLIERACRDLGISKAAYITMLVHKDKINYPEKPNHQQNT